MSDISATNRQKRNLIYEFDYLQCGQGLNSAAALTAEIARDVRWTDGYNDRLYLSMRFRNVLRLIPSSFAA
jgi:hypothetical protein